MTKEQIQQLKEELHIARIQLYSGSIDSGYASVRRACDLIEMFEGNEHIFCAPDDDKSSRFCICGKYLTDKAHQRSWQGKK